MMYMNWDLIGRWASVGIGAGAAIAGFFVSSALVLLLGMLAVWLMLAVWNQIRG